MTTDPWQHALDNRMADSRPASPDEIDLFNYIVLRWMARLPRPCISTDQFSDGREMTDAEIIHEISSNWGSRIKNWIGKVPAGYRTARVEALDPETQHREVVDGFPTGDARTLFLAGPVGTGKSYAAWAAGHIAAAYRRPVHGWSVPRLLLDMRPDGDPRAFDRACTVDFLILDDIATAKPTDWAAEQIYSIAEARTGNNLQTVITTNGSYDDLCRIWGEPTMDRWRHKSATAVFRGESRRKPLW